jgi:hypothetical protein
LSDAELITLAVAQQLLGVASERRWIRFARSRLAGLFPYLPAQSGYDKRLRSLGGLLAAVITELARDTPSWQDDLRMLDSTPLPCAASRETVRRSDLAGHAGYGYCASHFRFLWRFRLYLITTAGDADHLGPGQPQDRRTRGYSGPARTRPPPDRVRAAHHGRQRVAGRDFEPFVAADLGAHLIRPDRKDEPARLGKLARVRQWIEAVIDTLKASSPSETTAHAPSPASTPAPQPASSPWPPRSGTTGPSTHALNDPLPPMTTKDQSDSLI